MAVADGVRIHIVGLGVARQAQLSPAAIHALLQADRVLSSARQRQTVAHLGGGSQWQELPPLRYLQAQLQNWIAAGEREFVVLASGDPLFYGIGRWFMQHYLREQLEFYPAVSSVQAACHALGLALQDVQVVSVHGRPLAGLRRHLQPGKTLVLLTDRYSLPLALAQECAAAGLALSRLWVCENLGYPDQRIRHWPVQALLDNPALVADVAALQVSVLELHSGAATGVGAAPQFPSFPGIADTRFITRAEAPEQADGKGLLTKREVRLATLSLLQTACGDVVWDIGAGCGGVAVELAYWHPQATIVAIEQHPQRLACLALNRERFGVAGNLQVVAGRAPEVCAGLAAPQRIFIGGSDGNLAALLSHCWNLLPPLGVLVVSAVTESSRHTCLSFLWEREQAGDAQLESTQIAVSRASSLAGQWLYRPNLPVTLFAFTKYRNNPCLAPEAQLS
jgi:precorrin-6Y C5,15-methyltransferase (decarboxylating)